jgi:hypothetical protein
VRTIISKSKGTKNTLAGPIDITKSTQGRGVKR